MKAKMISGIWLLLLSAIGITVKTRTVWQMTPEGMKKIEEDCYDYHGPLALCNYGGRPVLSASQLQAHSVGTGDTDVVWWPLFDSISYPSAGATQFAFYSNPIGQGTSSSPGAGAVAKTIYDTNLQIGNQLTSGNEFFMIGSESNLSYEGRSVEQIFEADDVKFRSSMTLFARGDSESSIFNNSPKKYFPAKPD